MPFIEAGGFTVHYDLTGPDDAPVLLLANSIGSNFHIWDGITPALAQHRRVLRYDMRGHGLTETPPLADGGGYTMQALAQDALALIDRLGIERPGFEQVEVCGLSIGGMMAQALATLAPDRIAALALCDTASRIGPPSMWDDRIAAIRRIGLAGIADSVMARWFTRRFRAEQPAPVRGYVAMLSRTDVEGYIGCAMAIRDADLTAADRRIACPTLVLVGAEDLSTPPEAARALADLIPNAGFTLIEDAAHLPCIEQPQALADRLVAFFTTR